MPLRFLTSGESHGPALLAILEGLPAGLSLPAEVIQADLIRRQKGYGSGPRMKLEGDHVSIVGGLMEGITIGSPVGLMIENQDHQRWKGRPIPPFTVPRPGHADLVGAIKYGYTDLRPALERASARETAARVAIGAVCKHLLLQFGITVGGYVVSIGEISANLDQIPLRERSRLAEESEVRCPEPNASAAMQKRIYNIMQEKDTLGGVIEVISLGLPVGLGSYVQWDRRLDTRFGAAVLSIPAIKGVEIGPAFENSHLPGTQAQDAIRLEGEVISRPSLRSGGLEGGITTGQPLLIRAAMKPIATTLTPQHTVDLVAGIETNSNYERSDFCPVPRAVPVIEAMVAFVLADALIEKLGGDSLKEMLPRYETLKKAKLSDFSLNKQEHIWWAE
jgi:chorismate synthase